jgi:DNA-directed RNA polymerase specialized sigma24 family protein
VGAQVACPEADVHTQALTAISIERFIEVVNAMPAQRSRVASLAWRSGWPGQAIAEALGITPSMFSQHLAAARKTLRKELGPYVPLESSDQEGATGS